jgi:endonuclease/exonuclease/phosphatase (EEP) superfamily protein YafD
MKKNFFLNTLLLCSLFLGTAFAGPFDSLVFDKDQKSNLKKLTKLTQKTGFTVLWWNVAWGRYNKDHDIDKNLLEIIKSPLSPDVITMGEYRHKVLKTETLAILNETYPYSNFVPYTPENYFGTVIFSKHSIRPSAVFPIEWHPMDATTSEAADYKKEWLDFDPEWAKYWDRSFSYFGVERPNGGVINVAPVHLCSPWLSVFKKFGSWKTFRIIMSAQENPLLHQQEALKAPLERDFGPELDGAPLLLIGDFNIPTKIRIPILGGTTKMHKLLRGPLEAALDTGDDTFPTQSTAHEQTGVLKDHQVQLDQAFHNKLLKNVRGEVLNLKGSDHYPILIIND